MTQEELIELVANAIYEVNPWVSTTWKELPPTARLQYREYAKAAIDVVWEHDPCR
jgi:hypothetical protein